MEWAGVDQLGASLGDLPLEGDGARPSARPVKLIPLSEISCRGSRAGGHGAAECRPAGPHRRRGGDVGGQQEPGVVIDQVQHPESAAPGQLVAGRVDVPQVVAARPGEPRPPARRLTPPRRMINQAPADQDLMHRGHRRDRPAVPGQHRPDLLRPPPRPQPAPPDDLILHIRPPAAPGWTPAAATAAPAPTPRPGGTPGQPLIHLRPGDAMRRRRLPRRHQPRRNLTDHLKPELHHIHHLQRH